MDEHKTSLINPSEKLIFLVSNSKLIPKALSIKIQSADSLITDFGEKMSIEIRTKWNERINELINDCTKNVYKLEDWIQNICLASIYTLRGKYHETVDKDYIEMGVHYEKAASFIELAHINVKGAYPIGNLGLYESSLEYEMQKPDESDVHQLEEYLSKSDKLLYVMNIFIIFATRLIEAAMWDKAGYAYHHVDVKEAERCYNSAQAILEDIISKDKDNHLLNQYLPVFIHNMLSVASVNLADSNRWDKVESLYRKVAGLVYFSKEKKDNEVYHALCSILVSPNIEPYPPYPFETPDWILNVPVSMDKENVDHLLRLKAELGQRALDILIEDYNKGGEGYPVPETYYLLAILSEIYLELKDYNKCKNLVWDKTDKFADAFGEWTFDDLLENCNWSYSYLEFVQNQSLARGLLLRPDYQEFVNALKKSQEQHQRQELQHIRLEERIKIISGRSSIEEYGNELAKKLTWLDKAANAGSLVNAEYLFKQLKKRNWGEVVDGYSNAVEEELKQMICPKYLDFVLKQSEETYKQESQRQREQGSLGLIANITKANKYSLFWEPFAANLHSQDKEFLLKLPGLLSELTACRRPSVHGAMPIRETAEKARESVLGTAEHTGLLEKLVALKSSA